MAIAPATEKMTKKAACILCAQNCGVEIQIEDGHIVKVKGDVNHPASQGYMCQKSQRLDFYQNGPHRLTSPLRRRADGSFEEISWDTAIEEVAAKIKSIRDTHGGHALAQFGGGGQGNHLAGPFFSAMRAAMGTRYLYTSLAQEKTGGFWVDGKLFGHQGCHPVEDIHHTDFLLIIGTNPWQSHGFPQARKVLQEIAKDPNRKLVVVDPQRTETAQRADYHLQVRPGGDAHLLLAMLGIIAQEGLENKAFIEERTEGFDELRAILLDIPVEEYAREAGVEVELVRTVTREYASTPKACVRTDLGIEQTLHSTLNLYLSKLLWLVTGHLGVEGGNVFHSFLAPLVGHSREPEEGGLTTKVTGAKEIGKLFPPNVLAAEIDTDHPERIRGLLVDSGNPAMTAVDSLSLRAALEKLELLVVVDVAMTETARYAHYVLPASSQFEKWECTFFNFEFPANFFHLRRPLFEPQGDTLPEAEIYRRLLVAMGELPDSFPELEAIAKEDRKDPSKLLFPTAFMQLLQTKPELRNYQAVVLYATLGRALPDGADVAGAIWGACQQFARFNAGALVRAGLEDKGAGLGEALFQRILTSESGTVTSVHDYEDTWSFIKSKDHKIHLAIPEMFEEIEDLQPFQVDSEFPLVLQGGERRAYNANQIIRNGDWRKKDREGALKIHPEDAAAFGISDGGEVSVESKRAAIQVTAAVTDGIRVGFVSLPHGYGMIEFSDDGVEKRVGPDINVLTSADHCDAIAKTPFHKYVPVRVTPA